jgi:hypothetical protein
MSRSNACFLVEDDPDRIASMRLATQQTFDSLSFTELESVHKHEHCNCVADNILAFAIGQVGHGGLTHKEVGLIVISLGLVMVRDARLTESRQRK